MEAGLLDLVARLNPDAFARLDAFWDCRQDFLDDGIIRFDHEIHFYLAYLDYIERLRQSAFQFCYPEVMSDGRAVAIYRAFDLALAESRMGAGGDTSRVVPNDCVLEVDERIAVITGPNQGGKTTFARSIGQVFYLASLGCPVPGEAARLPMPDAIFAHFERGESPETGQGKLKDDLLRFQDILAHATAASLVILNEIFTSTTLDDAVYLSEAMLERLDRLGCLVVLVTFLDELQASDPKRVSFVALVDPHDPARRTYRVAKKPGDGRAYADALAKKHRLGYRQLKERLRI